ncbi:sodium- and chloride-dependent glycine transporter 2-like [Haliotis rubra]|uniref:sodium- and chloride-dependent glycine transporter 2-like n=1 Tax=Haliotis rubra TaxID=36100 RepID=UPI001EE50AA8|nr:sodium- and chloride-dependent glycine transporter 2-like [Haliotis rubra]
MMADMVGPRSPDKQRGHWASNMDYLLSLIGFSVGLSNVLRFPYVCNKNGGGAYLVPYVTCLMLCGLPLFYLEVAIGQFSGKGVSHVWSVCPLMKGLGLGMLIVIFGTNVYYTINAAWSLYYVVASCRTVLPWSTCGNSWNTDRCVKNIRALRLATVSNFTMVNGTEANSRLAAYNGTTEFGSSGWGQNETLSHTAAEEFWQYKALSISPGLDQVGTVKWELALCLFAIYLLIFGCIIKGIRSVGKAVYVTATLPYVFLIILCIRGLTLPGGPAGALFYISPNFSKILNIEVWLEACAQVFFSLGPAWGSLITMASYNTFHTNCLRNAVICTFVCGGTSLFAGVGVFSVLGFMAYEADVPITDVVSSGPGLGFVIYPEALAQLPVPQLWSFFFFIMLILLTLDSAFTMVETVISAIMDYFPSLMRWRLCVNAGYCLAAFLLGLIFATEGGMYVFQLVDWYFVTIFLILVGLLECIILGWIYGVNRVSEDVEMMTGRPVPLFFKVSWCFITPALLLIIFISTLARYEPPTYGNYVYPKYAATIGWCLATIPCIPLVVGMFLTIYKEEGTLLQRLRKSVRPNSSWGPAESSYGEAVRNRLKSTNSLRDTCLSIMDTSLE